MRHFSFDKFLLKYEAELQSNIEGFPSMGNTFVDLCHLASFVVRDLKTFSVKNTYLQKKPLELFNYPPIPLSGSSGKHMDGIQFPRESPK